MKYSETDLRGKLMRQVIGDTVLHYSLVKKEGKNLSFLTNERLLIYDNHRRILYYNNDFKNAPFKTAIPEPKNQLSTPITTSTFANPQATNNILVRHTGKNQKGELQTIEWNFTCDTKQLANEWMALLEQEKNKIMESNTGIKNAGFVHDTLLEAVKNSSPPKETILKPEQQIIKPQETSEIKNSKLTDPRRSQVQPNPSYSQNNPNNSNLRQTNQPNTQPPLAQSNLAASQYNQSSIQRTDPIDQSRNNIRQSQIRQKEPEVVPVPVSTPKNNPNNSQKQNSIDWNFKFLKNPTEATLFEFEQAAMSAWMAVWSKDCDSLNMPRRYHESQGLRIAVSNCFSKEASQLKRQFRNYHFLLQACKNKLVLGVPLCVLVELQGTVALIKAPLPPNSQHLPLARAAPEVRELERYTRVSNAILERATLLDVTESYGLNDNKRLVYVDNLVEYLPVPAEEELQGASLRPEYLLESVGQVVAGGEARGQTRQEQKALTTVCGGLASSVKELAAYLNEQETLWVDALQLKEIFHSFGVNLKLLPRVYEAIQNKQVRRCMQSVMAAKVAKDILTETLLLSRIESKVSEARVVEDYLRLLMQGNNSNSSEVWKELNLRFKKQFASPITNTELIPGFFLNSLIKLLRIRSDITKLNKAKKPFREEGVIGQGFVVSLQPKVKSYYRFSTEFIQKVRYACRQERKSDDIHDEIVGQLQLTNKPIPSEYQLNNNSQAICEYLAYYTPPGDLDGNAPLQHLQLYAAVLSEPPSAYSLRTTKAYLDWAVKKERGEEFKRTVEGALRVCEYWLQEGHLHQADLVQILSDFYASQGNAQESINFMKEALSRTIRNCGAHSRQAGARYYQLGERQLKAGRKRQALDSFAKAKANLLAHQSTSIKYPLLLMRTASLHLNNGSIDACLEGALDAIKHFDDYDRRTGSAALTEGYKVKTFEVLARAYQITGRRAELRSMASLCAKKFNGSQLEWSFEQMVRICLAAAIFTHSSPQCQQFLELCVKMGEEEHGPEGTQALRELMRLAESVVVMEKFLVKFDYLERVIGERNSKKPLSQDTRDFLLISKLVAAAVGEDYIEGLIQQKQYE